MEKNISESHDVLKQLSHELDHNVGALNLNRLTLERTKKELGRVSEDIENTDQSDLTAMGMTFRDIAHSVQILADLLHYTMENLDENFQHTTLIKDSFFNVIVRGNEEE